MIIRKINKAVLLRNSQLRGDMYIKRNALIRVRLKVYLMEICMECSDSTKGTISAWESYRKLHGGGDILSGS